MNALKQGATAGIVWAILYAFAFFLYALLRISWTLSGTDNPSGTWWLTLAALATACLAFTVLVSPLAALLGSMVFALTALVERLDKGRSISTLAVLRPTASAGIVLALHLLLRSLLDRYWTAFYPGAYWFWFGIPMVLLLASVWRRPFRQALQ